jgi:hypothetical protein
MLNMTGPSKRKRGAPLGNRNAVKHGFYSRAFNKDEQSDLHLAADIQGFTQEIALLRFEILKAASGGDTRNLAPIVKATEALEKLVRTHHKYFAGQDALKIAVDNVYKHVFIPLISGETGDNLTDQKTNNPENEADLTYNKKQIS